MKEIRCPRCNMLRGKIDEDGTFHFKIFNVVDIIAQIKTLHLICHGIVKGEDGHKIPCETKIFVEYKDGVCQISS